MKGEKINGASSSVIILTGDFIVFSVIGSILFFLINLKLELINNLMIFIVIEVVLNFFIQMFIWKLTNHNFFKSCKYAKKDVIEIFKNLFFWIIVFILATSIFGACRLKYKLDNLFQDYVSNIQIQSSDFDSEPRKLDENHYISMDILKKYNPENDEKYKEEEMKFYYQYITNQTTFSIIAIILLFIEKNTLMKFAIDDKKSKVKE